MKSHRIDWASINWSLPNDEIAAATGYAPSTVSYYRRGYGQRHHKRARYAIDWSGADWTKSNTALSEYYSCTPQAVAAARALLAPADLKISPSHFTRKKRMQAQLSKTIAIAEARVADAPAITPTPKPPSFWDSFTRFIGLRIS